MGHCCTLLVCFLLGIVYNTAASTDIDTIAIGDHVESSFTARTFTIRSCPSPLNWNAVANVSTQDNQGFFLSDCSRPALQRTYLKACYTASHLFFHFYCLDNNIYNPYTRCNDPLFQYGASKPKYLLSHYGNHLLPFCVDVVELFIAPQPANGQPTQHYIELELSPNSVLFVSNITNPYLDCQVSSTEIIHHQRLNRQLFFFTTWCISPWVKTIWIVLYSITVQPRASKVDIGTSSQTKSTHTGTITLDCSYTTSSFSEGRDI